MLACVGLNDTDMITVIEETGVGEHLASKKFLLRQNMRVA